MAGWKLRKDKTQSETADAAAMEAVSPTTEPSPSIPGAEIYVLPVVEDDAEPASRWEMPEEKWQNSSEATVLAPVEDEPTTEHEVASPQPKFFDLSGEPLLEPDLEMPGHTMEAGEPLRFEEEEEVEEGEKVKDEDPLVLMDYSKPPPAPIPLTFEAAPAFEAIPEVDRITPTLRMDRSELADAIPTPPVLEGVPLVAPFVLDFPPAAPPVEATHRLVMRLGRLSAAFELAKAVSTIGRPDSALHYYPDVEVELDDAVSRRHAEVLHRGGEYYVVDTGSTNGTMLNGELLPAHEERLLAHGDRIRVGERTELIFE